MKVSVSPDVQSAAGLIVTRQFEQTWRLIVLRQYKNWDLPKGLVDAGEDHFSAAIREAHEEIGLDGFTFPWGHESRDTAPYRAGKMLKVVRVFLAHSAQGDAYLPVSASLGRPEHHELRWVEFVAARSLLPARFHPMLDWADELLVRGARSEFVTPNM